MGKRIFVTGGAGYIGSQVVKALGEAGHATLTYDNLSTGHAWAVLHGDFVKGDLADRALLASTLREFAPHAVMHFAASIQVEESVRKPLLYYRNNVANSLNLLEAMAEAGIRNLIYSSSAAVYGIPERNPVDETAPVRPINPYGETKAAVEKMLAWAAEAGEIRSIALRYFNVAGADPDGRLGQDYADATHLITRALKAARGEIERLVVFGTDYPTPDGTCIRDYIHIADLASAHLLAIDYLQATGETMALNCGYGHGYSVREVIAMARQVTGVDFPAVEAERRLGDPPALVADSTRLQRLTGWRPRCDDLAVIIRSAWLWEEIRGGRV